MRLELDYPEYDLPEEPEDLRYSPSLGGYVKKELPKLGLGPLLGGTGGFDRGGEVRRPPIAGLDDNVNPAGLIRPDEEADLQNEKR
ncbi:hypothetical protein DYH09_25210 [bacterium CPR1]|nr:hypothetical protein [bacterium CPR1]MCG3141103.1 hypothetical protein [Anaerolineae bacterium]